MNPRALSTALITLAVFLAGCTLDAPASTNHDNEGNLLASEYIVAFSVKDDFTTFVDSTQPLADWITAATGVPTKVLPVEDESASIQALANGQAHAAFMDGGAAWIGWTTFGLDAILADREDGRTAYTAYAWARADSGIQTLEDLRGKASCHTGELKSAGMLVPMGYLIGHDYISLDGLDKNDISSLQAARTRFFSHSTIGGGYEGAFQCLSTGTGDVAFVKDSTWDDYCAAPSERAWCLARDAYVQLPADGFAQVPSHPLMVAKTLPAADRAALRNALLALNEGDAGRAILTDILQTSGLTAVETEAHLGSYGDVIQHVPGIQSYLAKKNLR